MKWWKNLLLVTLAVLIIGMTPVTSASTKTYDQPILPQYAVFGEVWKLEGIYLYDYEYKPEELRAKVVCEASEGCYVERSFTSCIIVSVWGEIKVDIAVIESEIGASIGSQECETITCGGYCDYGETLYIYVQDVIPIEKIVQRKYLITDKGEIATSEIAYAYVEHEVIPKCRIVSQSS